ncbi:MAG: hypothetical protein JSW52_11675 [Candidatus Coatesbacteria bacterium]|nr:MAG: hypothetical protein JSW52_11675 [Candidatus Coatesbacteria bacterium]
MLVSERVSRFIAELTFPRACYYLAATTFISCAASIAVGNKYVTPVLNVAAVGPFYLWAAARGRYRPAVGLSLLWLTCLALFFTVGATFFSERAGAAALYAEAYNADFNAWLADDTVAFGETRGYALQIVEEGGLAGGLSFITGGIGGLATAAVNANYVSYNAGRLLLGSTSGTYSIVFAWPFWEVLKVIGFVNLSVALGVPPVRLILRREVDYKMALEHAFVGLFFLATSVFVHWRAALFWRDVLADVTIIG